MLAEKSNFTIKRMARLLEVSRSGFYAWRKREPSKRAIRQEHIEQKVAWFPGDSDEVSGSPKILADLRDDGEIISARRSRKSCDGWDFEAFARNDGERRRSSTGRMRTRPMR